MMALEQQAALARGLFFLSAIIGKPILDREGERLGTIKDLIVRLGPDRHPPVTGLVAHTQGRDVFLPRAQIAELDDEGARLSSTKINLQRFARRDNEVLLGKDVLDRQLIDVNGRRVIRVNDLQLAAVDGEYRLVGVDVGGRALLRRLAPARLSRRALAGDVIDWAELEYFASHAPEVRLRVSHERVARLHPVEIARLVDALSYRQGAEVIEALDDETAAETLQEMTEERQADIVGGMDEELRRIVRGAVPDDRPIVAYCNGGVAATTILFALDRLGRTGANYDGSWNEWGRDPRFPARQGEQP